MAEIMKSARTCPACGATNDMAATTCSECGAELSDSEMEGDNGFFDSDPALEHVDPRDRVELARYETDTGAEAEIDCGLLRANGIACELGAQTIPGLPSNMILWVNKNDAEAARTLLDGVESAEPEEGD
jgi:hypothetical protein